MTEYAFYEYVETLPELVAATNQYHLRLQRDGRPVAADLLLKAFGELEADLAKLALTISGAATEALRKSEERTRVRPDTLGAGGPRLGDSLVAEPVAVGVLPGSVGVANKDKLDSDVPWWPTNEIGSSARVGGTLFGLFSGGPGGEAPPDSSQFREHPLFAPAPAESGAGLGVIHNPIPARYFIRDAIPEIDRLWKAGFHASKAKFDDSISVIAVTFR